MKNIFLYWRTSLSVPVFYIYQDCETLQINEEDKCPHLFELNSLYKISNIAN